jgi:hypothetical protein
MESAVSVQKPGLVAGLVAGLALTAGACVVPSSGGAPIGSPAAAAAPMVGGCRVFPADNAWNENVSKLAVRKDSQRFVASINATRQFLHADFGTNPTYGIPYVVVPRAQPEEPIHYTAYGDESDRGPFPIPATAT